MNSDISVASLRKGQLLYWIDQNGVQRSGRYVRLVNVLTALIDGEDAIRGERMVALRLLKSSPSLCGRA